MLVERVQHSGAIVISAIVNGYLFTRSYYGYTLREAKQEFKSELLKEKKG